MIKICQDTVFMNMSLFNNYIFLNLKDVPYFLI